MDIFPPTQRIPSPDLVVTFFGPCPDHLRVWVYMCVCAFLCVGLTLTAASTVYMLDPVWSAADEAQALNRAHRIGQVISQSCPVLLGGAAAAAVGGVSLLHPAAIGFRRGRARCVFKHQRF